MPFKCSNNKQNYSAWSADRASRPTIGRQVMSWTTWKLITWIRRDDVEAKVANVAKTWKLTWTPYSYLVGSLEADRLLYLQFLESTIYFYNFFIKIILFEKTSQFVSVVSQSDITCENLNYLRNNEANVELLPLTNE